MSTPPLKPLGDLRDGRANIIPMDEDPGHANWLHGEQAEEDEAHEDHDTKPNPSAIPLDEEPDPKEP